MLDAKSPGNRARHKFIGGRGNDHGITRIQVLLHQFNGRRLHGWTDHFVHKALMSRSRLRLATLDHGCRGKAHIVGNIELPGLIVFKESVVLAAKGLLIAPANGDGELAPAVVRIQRQQGVVQIKKGQLWLVRQFRSSRHANPTKSAVAGPKRGVRQATGCVTSLSFQHGFEQRDGDGALAAQCKAVQHVQQLHQRAQIA